MCVCVCVRQAAVLVEKLIASYPDYISIEDLCGTEVEMEEVHH